MLSQIRIAFSNVKPTSRAWNRFRMAWRKDVLKRADTNMFEEGLALFKVYEPALAGLLAHNKAYPAQLQAVRDSPEIWGLTDAANANHIADLPRVRSTRLYILPNCDAALANTARFADPHLSPRPEGDTIHLHLKLLTTSTCLVKASCLPACMLACLLARLSRPQKRSARYCRPLTACT